ncbi:hypothetical protein Thein_1506 [Thermodesulfatator indicus DSM 15286]|uniref:Predicted DNA-binding protein ribbon-helix-helix domain-containing protein n=1 Tax=Thermodesulfatator indicus (strain DSM 15286 / JCM 11887 / CIR29812) TaxID=667014 RepID=F8AAE7_THEID|nr:ribbon-helix-helix domain-containing protein [Thermodesulfatator indicus]AEH45367.1 hypothetical protein Thein_1506 [Thermodesulfatator indicus DSM 15286]
MGKDRRPFSTKLDRKLLKEIRHLSVELERPLNDLLEEAMRDLLRKYGREVAEEKNEA